MNRKTIVGDPSPAHRLPGTPFAASVCVGERPVSSEVILAILCPFPCGHLYLITYCCHLGQLCHPVMLTLGPPYAWPSFLSQRALRFPPIFLWLLL